VVHDRLLIGNELFDGPVVSGVCILSRSRYSPILTSTRERGGSFGRTLDFGSGDPCLGMIVEMSLRFAIFAKADSLL
jgi:hypothetical protein